MRPLALPCAALALLLVGTAQAGAAAPTTCPSYEYKLSGTSWSARAISVRRVDCGAARKLIRSYSRPRNCRFLKPCHLNGWTCDTLSAQGSTFSEKCTKGRLLVAWRGSYASH
jgi:hypothetical protein